MAEWWAGISHHQKTIIMDVDGELVAYVGGLDVTQGRFDNQDHPQWRDSDPSEQTDYYQTTLKTPTFTKYANGEPK